MKSLIWKEPRQTRQINLCRRQPKATHIKSYHRHNEFCQLHLQALFNILTRPYHKPPHRCKITMCSEGQPRKPDHAHIRPYLGNCSCHQLLRSLTATSSLFWKVSTRTLISTLKNKSTRKFLIHYSKLAYESRQLLIASGATNWKLKLW